jgi:hypothetical protein
VVPGAVPGGTHHLGPQGAGLSTCCYTVVTLLLHFYYTVATLLLHCCYTVVTHTTWGLKKLVKQHHFPFILKASCFCLFAECHTRSHTPSGT